MWSPQHVEDTCVLLLDCLAFHQLQVGFVDLVLEEPEKVGYKIYKIDQNNKYFNQVGKPSEVPRLGCVTRLG